MYEDDLELRPCKLQLSGFRRFSHVFDGIVILRGRETNNGQVTIVILTHLTAIGLALRTQHEAVFTIPATTCTDRMTREYVLTIWLKLTI